MKSSMQKNVVLDSKGDLELGQCGGTLYVFLVEVSVQVLCPFFKWIFCLPGVESCEFFIYFGEQTLVQGINVQYVFPYSWFPFEFADVFFGCAEALYCDEVPFVYSFLYVPCSKRHIGEILLCGILEIFLSIFSSKTLMVL